MTDREQAPLSTSIIHHVPELELDLAPQTIIEEPQNKNVSPLTEGPEKKGFLSKTPSLDDSVGGNMVFHSSRHRQFFMPHNLVGTFFCSSTFILLLCLAQRGPQPSVFSSSFLLRVTLVCCFWRQGICGLCEAAVLRQQRRVRVLPLTKLTVGIRRHVGIPSSLFLQLLQLLLHLLQLGPCGSYLGGKGCKLGVVAAAANNRGSLLRWGGRLRARCWTHALSEGTNKAKGFDCHSNFP